jgi:hypothetical protein
LLVGEVQEPFWFLPGISSPPFTDFLKKYFNQNNQNSLIIIHQGDFVKGEMGKAVVPGKKKGTGYLFGS